MTRATKPVAMVAIQIEYLTLLMPADKGMKVMELLQSGVRAEYSYDARFHHKCYTPQDRVEVCVETIKPAQVRNPNSMPDDRQIELSRVVRPH